MPRSSEESKIHGVPGDGPGSELRVGVIGLGMLGGGVAVSLARRGRVLLTHDLRSDAADALAGVPRPLPCAADVARGSDVVLVAVVDADQARAVLAGPDGLLAGARENLIVVLLATVSLDAVRNLAALCARSSVSLVDCGVTPGDEATQNRMVAMVGGEDDVITRAMPVLEDFAKVVVRCGPLGTGMATKIACNVIVYGSWRAVHEATELVSAAGVDPAELVAAVEHADPEGAMLLRWEHLRRTPRGARVVSKVRALMDKDLAAAQDLAATLGVAVPLVDVARTGARETVTAREAAS